MVSKTEAVYGRATVVKSFPVLVYGTSARKGLAANAEKQSAIERESERVLTTDTPRQGHFDTTRRKSRANARESQRVPKY
jgi:hypothetical protein